MPYVTASTNLPRSLDVQISLSRPQTETRTELDVCVLAAENLGFLPDSNRLRFYSTIEAVETDFIAGTEVHFAATSFFAQTPRAQTFAVGEVFSSDLAAELVASSYDAADITAIEGVSDGSFAITVDGVQSDVTLLDFTGVTTVAGIAAVVEARLTALAVGASCAARTFPGGDVRLIITSDTTGALSTITYASAVDPAAGTDVSAILELTAAEGANALQGYAYVGIADELSSIQAAAQAAGRYLYGWALGATLRDVAIQTAAAAWALSRTVVITLTTNDVNALDSAFTTDIGTVVKASDNRRAICIYHDDVQAYPDVSILAYMLHVNYRQKDSTVTAKFKQLPGIATVVVTETQWSVLQNKGYNTYTAIGNDAKTYRDGITQSSGWYIDTTINLDNFTEDLQVNVFNVFLRNKKVPYTTQGQMLLVDACRDTGDQYEFNATFADREVVDSTVKSGVRTIPAIVIEPTPVAQASAADRASRIAPPIGMTVYEAGAMHEVAINVEVIS